MIVALGMQETSPPAEDSSHGNVPANPRPAEPVDASGHPIPLDRREPQRILGFMPNFRTVSGGAKPSPPSWKYNSVARECSVASRYGDGFAVQRSLGLEMERY